MEIFDFRILIFDWPRGAAGARLLPVILSEAKDPSEGL
jgi:hypothetical protein